MTETVSIKDGEIYSGFGERVQPKNDKLSEAAVASCWNRSMALLACMSEMCIILRLVVRTHADIQQTN